MITHNLDEQSIVCVQRREKVHKKQEIPTNNSGETAKVSRTEAGRAIGCSATRAKNFCIEKDLYTEAIRNKGCGERKLTNNWKCKGQRLA